MQYLKYVLVNTSVFGGRTDSQRKFMLLRPNCFAVMAGNGDNKTVSYGMRKRVKKITNIRKAVHLLLCKKCGGNRECTRKQRHYMWWEEGYWK